MTLNNPGLFYSFVSQGKCKDLILRSEIDTNLTSGIIITASSQLAISTFCPVSMHTFQKQK